VHLACTGRTGLVSILRASTAYGGQRWGETAWEEGRALRRNTEYLRCRRSCAAADADGAAGAQAASSTAVDQGRIPRPETSL
jgi:hypothetical protein